MPRLAAGFPLPLGRQKNLQKLYGYADALRNNLKIVLLNKT
jgi:hypothetical protein